MLSSSPSSVPASLVSSFSVSEVGKHGNHGYRHERECVRERERREREREREGERERENVKERERERERERLRERVCYVTARSMYVGERGNHPRVRKGDQKIEREKKG